MDKKYPLSYVLVDDDEDDRLLIKLALQKAERPLPIYEFTNGQELIDYLDHNSSIREDNDYHWLIVMDINMPILDGISTLKYIRQHSHWQKIPILMLSTSSSDSMVNNALRSGANGYIVKPTSIERYKNIFDEFFVPWLHPQADN
jgi:CheY-like chemotaxis protein